jgi:hypothetical protein
MTADVTVRPNHTWATFVMMSGECSLEEKVKADDGIWQAGMAARIVDIDVTGVNRTVDAAVLKRMAGIEHHYGHAGPAFVRALCDQGVHRQVDELRDQVLKTARRLAGEGADSVMIRAATPFALLLTAGEMAKGFGVLPSTADIRGAVLWGWQRFQQSSNGMVLRPEDQIIPHLRTWIAERWDVTLRSLDKAGPHHREAVGWYDGDTIYLPKSRIREATGKIVTESQIGAILHKRGLLAKKPKPDRYTVPWVPTIGDVQAYALRRSEFGRGTQIDDPADEFVLVKAAGP